MILSAYEARKLAESEVLQIMNLIRESAYKGGWSITLDYSIKDSTIKVLENYGYKVNYNELPIYWETPYGKLEDTPSGYKKETIISWK